MIKIKFSTTDQDREVLSMDSPFGDSPDRIELRFAFGRGSAMLGETEVILKGRSDMADVWCIEAPWPKLRDAFKTAPDDIEIEIEDGTVGKPAKVTVGDVSIDGVVTHYEKAPAFFQGTACGGG